MDNENKKKVVLVSGGFDPIHIGHLRLFRKAKKLGDKLIVVLNDDEWLKRKKGMVFMNENERSEIISEFKCVDRTYILHSQKGGVSEALEDIKPDIFANGGDRRNESEIRDADVCKKLGIEMIFNVGGKKHRSSSEMLNRYGRYKFGGKIS